MAETIIIGIAVITVIAAIMAFIKTPSHLKCRGVSFKVRLEDQLAALPPRAEAVIIKADIRRCLIHALPMIVWAVLTIFFIFWLKHAKSTQGCEEVTYSAYCSVIFAVYVTPQMFFIFSLFFFHRGIKTLKSGYHPPLDSALFKDTIAKKGLASTLKGILQLSVVFFAIWTVYLGHKGYSEMFKGMNYQEIIAHLESSCMKKNG